MLNILYHSHFSSRFTDSKKYETDFIQCFQLDNPRRGEICNACVLLVKRFKRLPPGSNRHWGHVVDARTGPGLKSMTKFKKRKEEQEGKDSNYVSKIFKKNKKKAFKKETSSLGGSSDDSPPSPTESQNSDDYDDGIFEKKYYSYSTRAQQLKREEALMKKKIKRKNPHPTKNMRWPANHFNLLSDVVSDEQWRQRVTCCGAIYECEELSAVIINVASFKPCSRHRNKNSTPIECTSNTNSSSSSSSPSSSTPAASSSTVSTVKSESTSTTAIKKHQLFLKRHSEPSSITKSCDTSSNSSCNEFSNKEKTEPMMMESTSATSTATMMTLIAMEKDNMQGFEEKKNGEFHFFTFFYCKRAMTFRSG